MRGRDVSADQKAGFTGVLLKRHYRPGQRYVQLLFKSDQGQRLALSHDLSLVRSLTPGQWYQIEGEPKMANGKACIVQPTATPIVAPQSKRSALKRQHARLAVAGLVAVVLMVGIFGLVKGLHTPGDPVAAKASPVTAASPATTADGTVQGTTTLAEDQGDASSDTAVAGTAVTTSTTTAARSSSGQGTTVPPSTQQPPAASTSPQTDPVPTPQQPLPVDPTPTSTPPDSSGADTATPPVDSGTADTTTPTDTATPSPQQ